MELPPKVRMCLSNRTSLFLKTVFLAWAACGVGCGGDADEPSEIDGPRLEWDQPAESLQKARSLSFRLYVDDVERTLNGVVCRAGSGDMNYICAAPIPPLGSGRHVLQLTSVLNGVESPRSAPLEIGGTAGQLAFAREALASVSDVPSTACLTSAPTECFAVREVAGGLFGASALAPAPDGRLFFVEGNTRVRVVADGALLSEPALALQDDRARIVGLAVDAWTFPERRFVFVASTEERQSDQTQLSVTRYREVANTLGEGATILTGIPVPRDVPVSLAVDHDGHVYIAVPALDSGGSSSGSGVVLRITRDGSVPPDNRLGLPAFAAGFAVPSSLALDAGRPHIWLGGRDSGGTYAIGVVPKSPMGQPQSPRVVAQVASDQPVSFALVNARESPHPALFVLANDRLSKAIRDQNGSVAGFVALDLGVLSLTAVAATERRSLYVAAATSIYELQPF